MDPLYRHYVFIGIWEDVKLYVKFIELLYQKRSEKLKLLGFVNKIYILYSTTIFQKNKDL